MATQAPVRESERFKDAVSILLLSQPFFGNLLMKIRHVPDDKISTLYVSRNEMHYSPDFLDSLTDDEAVFVVAHEVMHLAWQHLPRLKHYLDSGVGPDGKKLDGRLFNMALDYPLNHSLVTGNVGKPMPKEKFALCLDPVKYPESMTPEEVYCLLREEQEKNGGKGLPDGSMDEHDAEPGVGADGEQEVDAVTPADILQAAEIHKAIKGSYPAGMERALGKIRKPDVSPWARLRQFITTNLPGHDRTSWKRLQRRMIVRGVGMPGSIAVGAGVIGIVGDTSGSIGQEMLNFFGGHMAAIIDDAKPKQVRIYWTDTHVNQMDVCKNASELRTVMTKPVKGGGGTCMPRGVQAAVDDKCDAIVVLTDGYTPFGEPCKTPVLWAITDHSISAPHGITIHI